MKRCYIVLGSILIGIIIGWVGKSYQIRGGVQLQFCEAARWGDIREMEHLIDRGADPLRGHFFTDMNEWGYVPIYGAASGCEPEAIEFLLKRGADPNELIATETPLDLVLYKQKEVERSIKILKKHGGKTLSELNTKRD